MIYCLSGTILKKSLDQVVIRCAGVGYQVQVPASVAGALPAVGQEAVLYTCMNVTENDVSLFGFADEEQQACFKMLTAVSGVGPKVGLAILSVLSPQRIALAASAGDHKAFTAASGVGPKLAQRITLELKDKVGKGLAAFPLRPGPRGPRGGQQPCPGGGGPHQPGLHRRRGGGGAGQAGRRPAGGRTHQTGAARHGKEVNRGRF